MLGTKKDTKGSVSNKVKSKRRKSKRRDRDSNLFLRVPFEFRVTSLVVCT